MWTELLAVTTPSRRELAVAFVALMLAGAALFGPQVAGGGFYWDDWQNSANVHIAGDPGLFSSLDRGTLRPVFGYRPVLTVMLVVEHWALGQDKHLHLAMAYLQLDRDAEALPAAPHERHLHPLAGLELG